MYSTYIYMQMFNIDLFIAEGRKREVNHSLGLFKPIYVVSSVNVLSIFNQNAC